MELSDKTNSLIGWLFISLLVIVMLASVIILVATASVRRIMSEENTRFLQALDHQEELLHSNLLVQEKERRRIAADLHDELASRLNIVRLNLQWSPAAQGPSAIKPIALIDEALDITRKLSHELDPPLLRHFGFAEALTDFLQPLQNVLQVQVCFLGNSAQVRFDRIKERQLFRVVQEMVNNVLKHAQAHVLQVNLRISERWVGMCISDDGTGFDPETEKGGMGLSNIESRMQFIRGKYRYRSDPEKGTKIVLKVPLNTTRNAC